MHLLLPATCASLLTCSLAAQAAAATPADLPNFVIIFADDLGYGDLGCFGSTKNRTPNIDRMAAEGLRLNSFYVTSGVCTPSRSSLMTGCYPRRVSMHEDSRGQWVLFPRGRKGLHPDETTVAEVLKTRGYRTACVGKWHLGDQKTFLPTRQGFDEYFGIPYSNDMNRPRIPLPLMRGEEVIEAPAVQDTLTQRYTAAAVKFITDNKDRPFFLYLPHAMPHLPLHASGKFKGKSANGRYGDAIEEIDWSTGEILAALKRLDLDEKTMVLFTSDNGSNCRNGGSNAPLRGRKGSTWEGGMRVPAVLRWPGRVPAGATSDALLSTLDVLPTLAGLSGGKLPEKKIDGFDIWPVLSGAEGAQSPRDTLFYFRIRDLQAVRHGKFKLHLAQPARGQTEATPARLFDLSADMGERTDIAAQHPEVVEQLLALAEKARAELGDGETQGKGQRAPGLVEEAVPLLKR